MRAAVALCFGIAVLAPAPAFAWSPFRTQNPKVETGNELMAKERPAEALEAYDEAARELPDAPGIQLNRGLALLEQELSEPAKEAFMTAADPSAPPEIRSDAYYDLGIVHARQGDTLSEQEEHEAASGRFREAANAFKRALRMQPGNRDAAWNLEYALNRIQKEEQKQQQQDSQQQDPQQQDPQQQDPQQQDPQQQDPQQQDPQQQDPQQQDPQQQDPQQQDPQQQDPQQQDPQQQDPQQQDPQQQDPQQSPESDSSPETTPQGAPPPPTEVERFLEALEQNEEALPVQRARRRSTGRRPPEKDW